MRILGTLFVCVVFSSAVMARGAVLESSDLFDRSSAARVVLPDPVENGVIGQMLRAEPDDVVENPHNLPDYDELLGFPAGTLNDFQFQE